MRLRFFLPLLCLGLAGCGSSSLVPRFLLAVAPAAITLQNGGSGQSISVAVIGEDGFAGPVSLSLAGLPSGVVANPSSTTVNAGTLAQFTLSANGAATGTASTVTVSGLSGELTAAASASLTINPALSSASLSATTYDFGGLFAGTSLTKGVATVTNTGSTQISLNPTLKGDASFSLVPAQSCGTVLDAGASCTETVTYAPGSSSGVSSQSASLDFGLGNVASGTSGVVTLTGESAAFPQGTVVPTNNPLVAQYSLVLPFPGTMTVHFGADTTYGRQTSAVTTTANNQTATILVAGMPQQTEYHLQAQVTLANGSAGVDADHTFSNGNSTLQPQLTVVQTPGVTIQPGVEELTFVDSVNGVSTEGLVITDLQGQVLWSYASNTGTAYIQGAKLLSNGDFLLSIANNSEVPLAQNSPDTGVVQLREIDLAGNVVRSLTIDQLNQNLEAAGYDLSLQELHHDVLPLPNGHWMVLSNTYKSFTDLPGYPGTTNVLGDVLVEVDENSKPVWVWNSFDHLDVNRHPYLFPDWTHSNAVLYSPDDHDLILSMRHQNWILKLDYQDGSGTGNVLWHLGQGGDFTLVNGTDPTDWQYAQHFPSLFSPNSSGVFSLGVMDNGDDRLFPTGVTCGSPGAPVCLYSTVPVFQLNESAKTATLTFHQVLDPSLYSYFGGNTEQLANGDIEYDLAGTGTNDSDIFEVTPTSTPQTLWHLHSSNAHAYRGYRLPSLYPGVQW